MNLVFDFGDLHWKYPENCLPSIKKLVQAIPTIKLSFFTVPFHTNYAFIEDEEVIKKTLKHLGLWETKTRPPPKVKAPFPTIYLDDSESQILSP